MFQAGTSCFCHLYKDESLSEHCWKPGLGATGRRVLALKDAGRHPVGFSKFFCKSHFHFIQVLCPSKGNRPSSCQPGFEHLFIPSLSFSVNQCLTLCPVLPCIHREFYGPHKNDFKKITTRIHLIYSILYIFCQAQAANFKRFVVLINYFFRYSNLAANECNVLGENISSGIDMDVTKPGLIWCAA